MKIVNVCDFFGPKGGGAGERGYRMTRALLRAGHDVRVVTSDRNLDLSEIDDSVRARATVVRTLGERYPIPLTVRRVRAAVRGADLIHLMSHWSFLNALAYAIARSERIPYVFGPAGALPPLGRSLLIKKAYEWIVGRRIASHAERVIAITEMERQALCHYGVPDDRIVIIPNGIELLDPPGGTNTRREERPFVLFLGRLNNIKGPDLLLEAYCTSPKVRDRFDLVFAGPDEGMRESLERTVEAFDARSTVRFVGEVTGARKLELLYDATFLAVPSRREAMSIVALEAGAVGTPVLITDSCGFDVASCGGGVVVPASVEGIRDGLEAMAADDDLSVRGRRLHQLIEREYDWDVIGARLLDVYQVVCG